MNRSTIVERSDEASARSFRALGDPGRLAILTELRAGTRRAMEDLAALERQPGSPQLSGELIVAGTTFDLVTW